MDIIFKTINQKYYVLYCSLARTELILNRDWYINSLLKVRGQRYLSRLNFHHRQSVTPTHLPAYLPVVSLPLHIWERKEKKNFLNISILLIWNIVYMNSWDILKSKLCLHFFSLHYLLLLLYSLPMPISKSPARFIHCLKKRSEEGVETNESVLWVFLALFLFFWQFYFLIVFFPIPFNPLILPSPLQSKHCCPCPQVLFSFCSICPLPNLPTPHSCHPALYLWVCLYFAC